MIKALFILFFGLFTFQTFAQSKIERISFKSRNVIHSPIIETFIMVENSGVEVKVNVVSKEIHADSINNRTTIDTTYIVKYQVFGKLSDAVLALPSSALMTNISFKGLGGCQTSVEFGNEFNSITYNVWSPNVETKQRQLDPYIAVAKLLIKAGKLNYKDLIQ
jgi:hypothetical protein